MTRSAAVQSRKQTQPRRASSKSQLAAVFSRSSFTIAQLPTDKKPQIAVAGRSNVGKSSLLNSIFTEKHLAKVSATPGKTQSLNLYQVDERYYLVDLPGYGFAKVPKSVKDNWSKLVETYLTTCEALIGMILLVDCRREIADDDTRMLDWLRQRELPCLVILTKTDKLGTQALGNAIKQTEEATGCDVIPFSTKTHRGKAELVRAIRDIISERVTWKQST